MKKIFIKVITSVVIVAVLMASFTSNVFAVTLFYEPYDYIWTQENILELSVIEELGYLSSRDFLNGIAYITYIGDDYSYVTVSLNMSIEYFNNSIEPEIMEVEDTLYADYLGGEPEGVSITSWEFYVDDVPWIVTFDIVYKLDDGTAVYKNTITVTSDGYRNAERRMIT